MKFHDINKISQYNTLISFQFQRILLTFTFAFDDFESFIQNISLIRTSSRFANFGLSNGESRKSQYRSYLNHRHTILVGG